MEAEKRQTTRGPRTRLKRVLVTGFEPFGGEELNPSAEIVRHLNGREIAGAPVTGAVLPCVFGRAASELKRLLGDVDPAVVIAIGQAGGRAEITPERVAINVDDARIPDNAGAQPVDRPVVRGGPAAYWTTLPIKAIVTALRARGVPAAVSQTAGTFVCNHVFYAMMHALRARRSVRAGFVHVPWLPEQAKHGTPSLPLAKMVEAVAVAVELALTMPRDLHIAEGRTE